MSDVISAVGLEAAQAANGPQPAADPKASVTDVRDFDAAMQRMRNTTGASEAAAPNAIQGTPKSSEAMRGLLTVFDRLEGGANSIRTTANQLGESGKSFTPAQVIELTMQCQQFMFQTQLTSNVANRTSDGIQQLFRQQS